MIVYICCTGDDRDFETFVGKVVQLLSNSGKIKDCPDTEYSLQAAGDTIVLSDGITALLRIGSYLFSHKSS